MRLKKIAFMVSSSQGKPLDAIQRAKAYRRMVNLGMTKEEISKSVGRSRADIDNHLIILEGGSFVIDAVKNGDISATDARHEIKRSGNGAGEIIKNEIDSAKAAGVRARVRRFTKKHLAEVMSILNEIGDHDNDRLSELIELYNNDRS